MGTTPMAFLFAQSPYNETKGDDRMYNNDEHTGYWMFYTFVLCLVCAPLLLYFLNDTSELANTVAMIAGGFAWFGFIVPLIWFTLKR